MTARQFGVEIGDLRARQVNPIDLERFNIIAVMEQSHRRQLLKLRGAPHRAEIRLLLSWLGRDDDVPDPYYDDHRFVPVYRLIEQAVDALFAKLSGSSGS